jgi:hypothetical protein
MGLMRDSSIAARTEELRREIALIQQEEHSYGSRKNHSLAENAEHNKRFSDVEDYGTPGAKSSGIFRDPRLLSVTFATGGASGIR